MHNKGITLIELMVVVIVLGILVVIAVPNIKNIKGKAQTSVALENKNTMQKGLDRYFLEKEELPVSTAPTKGIPTQIDWNKLVPPYIRSKPADTNKIKYWVDYNNTVWVSNVVAPAGVVLGSDNKTVTWSAVEGATGYEVGYIEESAAVSNNKIMAGKGYKELQEVTGATSYTSLADLSGKTVVVSAISKDFKSVPAGAGYGGYIAESGSSEEPTSQPDQLAQLKLGDYIKYGEYNGYDLTWQVVEKTNGDVMLFATDILKNTDGTAIKKYFYLKPNSGEPADSLRNGLGSNNWYYSDMRTWLNVDFYNTAFTNNTYIKDTSYDYILANIDKTQATNGTESHIYDQFSPLQNYDTAYKRSDTDKVYLVNIKEITGNIQQAIGNKYNLPYLYWTRDSFSTNSYHVRFVSNSGNIGANVACSTDQCIRPAVNLSSAVFKSGSETQADPYILE